MLGIIEESQVLVYRLVSMPIGIGKLTEVEHLCVLPACSRGTN